MALLKHDPKARAAYVEHKREVLAKNAPARKRAAKAKAAYNAGAGAKPPAADTAPADTAAAKSTK
jgi:hypothetical protein